jgi:succinoglycan biosynthesis transport protein ExoP
MSTALEATLPANDLSIADLWPIYLRRKRLFYVILAAVVLPVLLYCCVATRRYQATGSVEVQNPMVGGMELSDVFNSQELSTDAMTTGLDLQTQADILQSQTLALLVIRELNLEQSVDFKREGVLTKVLSVFTFWKKPATPNEAARRARDLQIFSKNLKVKVESGTRLIRVSYRSADALVAAQVVNHLITDLVEFDLQTRSAAGTHASKWLAGQLGDLRKQSEGLQAKVVKLQQQMGIFSLGDNDSTGKPQVYSTVLDQVQQDTAALSAAQSNRILKGALYQVVKDGNPELISGLTGNSMSGASPAVNNSLGVIQNLREQEATLKEEIAHDSAKFGANYPPLNEKRAALKGLDQSIAAEDSRIAARAKSDYDIAVNAEANTRKLFEQARNKADQLNNKAIEFTIAQKQADESRGLFEDLSKRLQEAGLVQGLRPSNIATVDPGQTPAKPSFPNVPLFMAAAVGAGLFFGSAGALFADIVDRRVQTVDEIEHGDLPLLGIVPHLETKRGGYSLEDVSASRSAFHEAMRGLRISLMWNDVLKEPRVVLVTSALAGEGKSTIAKGLAMAMAQRGRKVLLIEADLYRPCMKKDLDLDDRGGLSMVLREDSSNPDDGMVTPFPATLPNRQILQAGEAQDGSADLLESSRMNSLIKSFRGRFDTIILDGPPILSATDAVPLAMLADTTILVARVGQTPRIALSRACNKLQTHKRHCDVRVALNAIKADSYAFYNYYGTRQGRAQEEEQHASA